MQEMSLKKSERILSRPLIKEGNGGGCHDGEER